MCHHFEILCKMCVCLRKHTFIFFRRSISYQNLKRVFDSQKKHWIQCPPSTDGKENPAEATICLRSYKLCTEQGVEIRSPDSLPHYTSHHPTLPAVGKKRIIFTIVTITVQGTRVHPFVFIEENKFS